MATILKRCGCPERARKTCEHPWVVRYRTTGGRSGRQREKSFGRDRREAQDFALKIEYDKRARTFIDPKAGEILFRKYSDEVVGHRIVAESTREVYASLLRTHINPTFGNRPINAVRREDIKKLITTMIARGLGPSRIHEAHLVVSMIFNEAVRDKKITASPCVDIELPDVVTCKDFILPTNAQVETLAAALPDDWSATVWLMHGCGLRIGEALAVSVRCRVQGGRILRVTEQVNPTAQLRPLKFRKNGDYRDVPLPQYVSEKINKHIADYSTTDDGYLFRGRKKKLVTRNSYRQHFVDAVTAAGLSSEFVPHSLRHYFASIALSSGIPITDVSSWLGHRSIEVTYRIYGHLVPGSWDRAREILDAAFRDGGSS
jgi:integrase